MKLHWIAVVLLGLASSVQSKSSFTEVEAVPPEEITKSWRAEITLSGTLEGYALNGANSVTLIDGFGSFAECQKQTEAIVQALMNAAKSANNGNWIGRGPSVGFGCHKLDMFMH